jgi:hypothetical protein
MKSQQVSIAKLMVVVGVVAFNLGSIQFWSHSSDPSLLTGRCLTSIALQIGLYGLIRSRRSKFLPFWAGFEVFGLVAAIISVYIDFFSQDDSGLFDLMDIYFFEVMGFARRVFLTVRIDLRNGNYLDNFVYEIVSFFPQLCIALIGGFLASLAVRFLGKGSDPVVLGTAAN